MEILLKELKNIYDMSLMLFIVIIGLLLIFWDSPRLKKGNMKGDSKIAKILGEVYIGVAVVVYVFLQFI